MPINTVEQAWKEYASQVERIESRFAATVGQANQAVKQALGKRCDALSELQQCHINLMKQLMEEDDHDA